MRSTKSRRRRAEVLRLLIKKNVTLDFFTCAHARGKSKDPRARMQIKDKRAVVIGASDGLGAAFGKELLRNGVAVRQYFLSTFFFCFGYARGLL